MTLASCMLMKTVVTNDVNTIVRMLRRQCGSVVRVGALNAGDPHSNPRLGLLNEFVLGDPRGKFTTLCK